MFTLKNLKSHPLFWTIALASIVLFILSSLRHLLFQSTAFELGIYDQVAYLISQGLPPFSTFLEVHHLGNHAAWAMYPVGWIYNIYPFPYCLLLIQAVSLAIGALPAWGLARHAGLNKRLSFSLALVYLLYPVVFNINLFDFHPEVMALPAMLGAILAARLDKTGWFCLAIIWVLGCKDALSLPVAAMGFWLFFFEKKRRCGAIALFIGSAWFIIVTQALIPAFKDGRGPGGLGRYTYLGESIGEIIINMLLRPDAVIARLFSPGSLVYFLLLIGPIIWWLSFKYWMPLLGALPVLMLNILSVIDAQRDLIHQYSVPILPFLLIWVIDTIADGKCGLWYAIWRKWFNRDGRENAATFINNKLPKFIVVWSVIGFLALAKYGYFWTIYLDNLDTVPAMGEAVSLVTTKGGVLTTSNMAPHLSDRQLIKLTKDYEPPTDEDLMEYDYVLLNLRYPGWKSSKEFAVSLAEQLTVNPEFELVYRRDDVYVFFKLTINN